MLRRGKFNSNKSLKRPYFVSPLREQNGKMRCSTTSKFLKRETNRKVRRTPVDSLASGGAYKRLIEVWDYNGDLGKLHYYISQVPEDVDANHIIVKSGRHYFPK